MFIFFIAINSLFMTTRRYLQSLSLLQSAIKVLAFFIILGLFKWDSARQRVILSDAKFAGDRIEISALTRADDLMTLTFKKHGQAQSMSEAPEENDTLVCVAKAFKWVDC